MTMENFWDIVEQVIKESDLVLEVIDASMPERTRNKKAEIMVKKQKKKLIVVFNKSDLVEFRNLIKYKKKFEREVPCVFVSSRDRKGITLLKRKIFELVKKRSRDDKIKIGVIGYPNTGKSSLINALAGKKKAGVSSKPGFTRGFQWINAGSGLMLIDTPGVIPLNEEDEINNALIGVIDPSKIEDLEGVARNIFEIFSKNNRERFEKFYEVKIKDRDFEEIVNEMGLKMGMLKKGGIVDENRVYLRIIEDWQKGRLRI
ncbi:MAG: GTPase [Candidatus Aenigmatarchaeota archaeon]